MLTFIMIVLVLSFLFRRGGLFMGRGLFGGGLFGGFPFFMGGGYRRRPPFHHGFGPGPFGPMGGHGMGGPFGHGPMGGGPGGRGGRF
ncbi:MAG: hypothetical protein IK099_14205 [Clostridia bacterium]|nr:hypothetical protein [Clostridia bacterium]